MLEPVDKWQHVESFAANRASGVKQPQPFNILDEFYGDPERYAYTFQNYVFMTRYLQEIESRDAKIPLRIMERSVFSDRMIFVESVHEKAWMSDLELSLFNGWYEPVVKVRKYTHLNESKSHFSRAAKQYIHGIRLTASYFFLPTFRLLPTWSPRASCTFARRRRRACGA